MNFLTILRETPIQAEISDYDYEWRETPIQAEISDYDDVDYEWIASVDNDFADLDLKGRFFKGSCYNVDLIVNNVFARRLTEDECALLDGEVENAVEAAQDAILRERMWRRHG
jgi:hypothetical protein